MNSKCILNPLHVSTAPCQNLERISWSHEVAGGDRSESTLSRTHIWRIAWGSMAVLLLALGATLWMAPAQASAAQLAIGVSVRVGPPPLPVYAQPICPGPGYIWTPGYWAYDPDNGYYWVPGTWVLAPAPGLLWTPGYWGWGGGVFMWHAGYWGPRVGFYGGINYGFGYFGVGYAGGYWRGRSFFYNRAVNNVNVVNVTNVYNRTVVNNVSVSRVSYNGGPGGLGARPSPAESAAAHDRHVEATRLQQQHQQFARQNRAQFASVNHGKPNVVATARPGEFRGNNAARAGGWQKFGSRGPNQNAPSNGSGSRGLNTGGGATHPTVKPGSPSQRTLARPEGNSAGRQSPKPYAQASRGAMPNYKAGESRPPAQKHNATPVEGGKPQQHEAERRR